MKLDTSKWQSFELRELFDIGTGAICKAKDLRDGDTPRISVKGVNNGIQGYFKDIDSKDYRTIENFISFSFLGTCFYHPYKASLDMKVHSLKPKNYKLNTFSGLFLVNVLRKSFKGVYDNQISSTDLKQEKILLPTIAKDKPDWEFMENCIKKSKKDIEKLLTIYRALDSTGGGGVKSLLILLLALLLAKRNEILYKGLLWK
ncbi:restriction endonuclease subunit S [Helicobacter cinaedi]|uniref:Type II restriction-modification specificity subunit n=1 Tax=Helicobacter cinaedi TaxID=213 RepID=A0A377JVE0_9HELI|nr:restriction endonuclease subunit S [Helicobacter cinaedi]STP13428.1 Type II restriction-modification specificity subunit [Helicobacter cinaedi]